MEPPASSAPINAKIAALPPPPAPPVLIPPTGIFLKTANASQDTLTEELPTAQPAHKPASHAPIHQLVLVAMPPSSEALKAPYALAWTATTSSTTLI